MQILICHERYEPDFAGGGEVVVHQTALHLAKRGHDVQVMTTGDPQIRSFDGIPTHRLPIHRYRFNLASRSVAECASTADLIQTFNYNACLPALAAGRRLGIPVVCGILGLFADSWPSMRGPVLGRLYQAWEKFLLQRNYSRVFFLSEFSRKQGIALGVDPDRTFIASPGVDSEKFSPAESKDDVVLFAAKLDPRKGIEELITVARALPHVRFRVLSFGSSPCAEPLYTLRNVELIQGQKQDSLRHEFARARIFFLPSRAETYGLVITEAMASGCAIVSTIDLDYAGVHVPVRDTEAMIHAVDKLWASRDKTASMGQANRCRALDITWENYAEELHNAYLTLINSS